MTTRASLPSGVPLLVGNGDGPHLSLALRAALENAREVVLLTDDEEFVPAVENVIAIEPERVLAGAVEEIEEAFDAGARAWLARIFPGRLDGFALGDVMWGSVFTQPAYYDRARAVALARRVLDRVRPSSVEIVGPLPHACETLVDEARRRGVSVREPLAGRLRRAAAESVRWPVGVAATVGLQAREIARAVQRVRARKRADARMGALARRPISATQPRLWIAVDPAWAQPTRFLLPAIFEPLEARGVDYGLLFAGSYGSVAAGKDASNELSLLDGTLATLRPSAIDEIAGPRRYRDLADALVNWWPRSVRAAFGVLRHGDDLEIGGACAASVFDLPRLLPRATRDLLLVAEADVASRRFVAAHPGESTVVFNLAAKSENVIADLVLQRCGHTTVDYMHGYPSEGTLRTLFRSRSTHAVAWTVEQAEALRARGTNRHFAGGYLPWRGEAAAERGPRPRVLVLQGYACFGSFEYYEKHARRLARALEVLERSFGSRVELRVRLHPHDDRQRWERRFALGHAPRTSDSERAATDLGWADIVIATPSSAFLEILLRGVPVLLHRGPMVSERSVLGRVPAERWFETGEELVTRISTLLDHRDVTIERSLLRDCFGASEQPRSMMEFLRDIGSLSSSVEGALR